MHRRQRIFILVVLSALLVILGPMMGRNFLLMPNVATETVPVPPAPPALNYPKPSLQTWQPQLPATNLIHEAKALIKPAEATLKPQALVIVIPTHNPNPLLTSLRQHGLPAYIPPYSVNTQLVYIGPYLDKQQAETVLSKLKTITSEAGELAQYDPLQF